MGFEFFCPIISAKTESSKRLIQVISLQGLRFKSFTKYLRMNAFPHDEDEIIALAYYTFNFH